MTQLATDIAEEIDIESIELDTTKYVDKSLNEFYSDIVYNAKTKENQAIKVALLFEHKSYPERFPRLQLMDYLLIY